MSVRNFDAPGMKLSLAGQIRFGINSLAAMPDKAAMVGREFHCLSALVFFSRASAIFSS